MRIIVTGGRDFNNLTMLLDVLDHLNGIERISRIAHGGATGADTLAGEWAEQHRVECAEYPAHWTVYGNAAGPIRNATMLANEKPDFVVAFPGGAGTADMVAKAKVAGVGVIDASLVFLWCKE